VNHRVSSRKAFTLFEVLIALTILGLLAGAVFSIAFSATDASRSTLDEQASVQRLEAFLRVTREAFLGLPATGRLHLRMVTSGSGAPVPELVFEDASGLFGVPSLGKGSLVLAASPRADGSRTFSLLRVPTTLSTSDLARFRQEAQWIPLLPRVEKVRWLFRSGEDWLEEWPEGKGRPTAVRLQFTGLDVGDSRFDVHFFIPILATPSQALPPSPEASPTP